MHNFLRSTVNDIHITSEKHELRVPEDIKLAIYKMDTYNTINNYPAKHSIENHQIYPNYIKKDFSLSNDDSENRKDRVQARPALPAADEEIIKANLKKIDAFLLNRDLVIKQLSKLEKVLEAQAGGRFNANSNSLVGYVEGKYWKQNKLLSSYLKHWAKHNGFAGILKMTKSLTPDKFQEYLANNFLFKDTYFRQDETHGELTHLLQWWCIVEYHKESNFLTCSPSKLYTLIGKSNPGKFHWFNSFEIPKNDLPSMYGVSNSNSGFGNTETFNKFLMSEFSQQNFPVLYQLLKSKKMKNNSSFSLKP